MKRKVIVIFLVVFTLWPLAHRALVAAFNVNPWKLAGWAMFCVPNPKTFVRLVGGKDGNYYQLEPLKEDRTR